MPWTSATIVPVARRADFRRPLPDTLPGLISGTYEGSHIAQHTYEALLIVVPLRRFIVLRGGVPVLTEPGDICVGGVLELHAASASSSHCHARVFLVSPDLLQELARSVGMRDASVLRFGRAALFDRPLARALTALGEELDRPVISSDAAERCRGLLRQLVQSHADEVAPMPEEDRVARAIGRVQSHLQRHATECVALDELAELACVSKSYLVRTFHRAVGLPPHSYQVQLRIARAARLIAMGASLSRAALDAGFADQSHLSRKFKSAYGLTPLGFARGVRSSTIVSAGDRAQREKARAISFNSTIHDAARRFG
ncbi:MAG: Helix-turn-helix, AraC protein, partial [Gemmatimonadetes bacterium]|nr:Helix-turn-helix, AraC protein [Gemmatimonadota bacterium]